MTSSPLAAREYRYSLEYWRGTRTKTLEGTMQCSSPRAVTWALKDSYGADVENVKVYDGYRLCSNYETGLYDAFPHLRPGYRSDNKGLIGFPTTLDTPPKKPPEPPAFAFIDEGFTKETQADGKK